MGAVLIAAPWILGFADGGGETWVPVILGVSMISLALVTKYELGLYRWISMRTHLTIDLISGVLLAASPWLFFFSDYVWEPHLVLGGLEIGAALMTKRYPSNETTPDHRHTVGAH
jgi:hypothetical protein